ncbi:glycosyltransferase [Bacillus sp. E(2018)]|uniref:glycosyltransferase n=1 Tax=Bacillus sp. E(2018) TaxID=2502239 RepID=UPI0010F94C7C|nr:glycosyltransferase [Bacillus sp. E(2018)]
MNISKKNAFLEHDLTEFLKQFMVNYRFLNPRKKSKYKWNKEVLFITKFPPVIGGVATQEYWRARHLALNGFKVRVVTNCNEADVSLRSNNWRIDDLSWIDFTDQKSGGLLKTYFTEPSFLKETINQKHRHIPMDSMSQSKLFGLAYKVIKEYNSSVIISGYLEPYGAAANELSIKTGIPVYQHFAGSDIERLSNIPEIGWRYESLLQEAAMISTSWDKLSRLLSFNIPLQKLNIIPPPTLLPSELFCTEGKKMYVKNGNEIVLGIYGKYSPHKCAEELLQASLQLIEKGLEIKVFLLLVDEYSTNIQLMKYIDELKARNAIIIGRGVPPWRIPEFIRSCDAICLLESDFPIKVHAPITPLEVALCGKPILFSNEMYNKIRIEGFEEGKNCIVIDEPRNIDQIALGIKRLSSIDDNQVIRLSKKVNKNINYSLWDDYTSAIESLFGFNGMGNYKHINMFNHLVCIYSFFPLTLSLLENYSDETYEWVQTHLSIENSLNLAYEFQGFLKRRYSGINVYIDDAISYEGARVESFKLALELKPKHVENHLIRMNFLDEDQINCQVKLRNNPILVAFKTNIVDIYNSLFQKSFTLCEVETQHFLFLSSNGLTYHCFNVSKQDLLDLEKLRAGISIQQIKGKSQLLKQLTFYNYLTSSIEKKIVELEELNCKK